MVERAHQGTFPSGLANQVYTPLGFGLIRSQKPGMDAGMTKSKAASQMR
jgi:hypothetical protein